MPSDALIVRDGFPAREAGARVRLVLMATVAGMAIGPPSHLAVRAPTGSVRPRIWRYVTVPTVVGGYRRFGCPAVAAADSS